MQIAAFSAEIESQPLLSYSQVIVLRPLHFCAQEAQRAQRGCYYGQLDPPTHKMPRLRAIYRPCGVDCVLSLYEVLLCVRFSSAD